MIADNIKASPLTLEQAGLTLTSEIEGDRLIVQGLISESGTQYIGQLNDFKGDLEDFQELIADIKKVKVFPISENLIKIKVGGTPIQLISKPKKQDQNHTENETIQTLLKTQSLMKEHIKQNSDEILQQKTLISELQRNFDDLKQKINADIVSQESLKETVTNLSSQTQKRQINNESASEKRYKELYQLVKNKKQSQKVDTLNEYKIEEVKNEIDQLRKQITELKLNFEDKLSNSFKVISTSQIEKPDLQQEKMQQNTKKKQMIKSALSKKFETIKLQFDANNLVIDDLKKQLRRQKNELEKTSTTITEKLTIHETSIKATQKTVFEQGDQLKEHKNKINETSATVSQQSEKLKEHQIKLKELIRCLQRKLTQPLQKLLLSLIYSRLNEPIRSSKWSEQLKSKSFTINNNVVTLTKKTGYLQFCLLNASFSNTIKSKQSWAIKITRKASWIGLGVCLKSKMLNYNFNSQNINWYETGHELYMIGSDGDCYSHSQKEFNWVEKGFKFGENDVIYVEYDPIDLKLRFSKNKVQYFELPIIAPQQNDAYHPLIAFRNQNESVQLLPASQVN